MTKIPRSSRHSGIGPRPSALDADAIRVVEDLSRLEVQKLQSQQELSREHIARLARFAKANVREHRWGHLKRCDGGPCPHDQCSAACAYGERYQVNKLVLEATELLSHTRLPLYFVHLIDPHYFRMPGGLSKLSIDALFQSLRRRFRDAPEEWQSARAVGGLHIAFDRYEDGAEMWTPHVHLVVAVDAAAEEVSTVLRPKREPPVELVGRKFRPVIVTPVNNLANAMSYASKVFVDTRGETTDSRGNRDRRAFELPLARRLEHDRWLLRLKPRERIFLRGMMNSRGGLVLRG